MMKFFFWFLCFSLCCTHSLVEAATQEYEQGAARAYTQNGKVIVIVKDGAEETTYSMRYVGFGLYCNANRRVCVFVGPQSDPEMGIHTFGPDCTLIEFDEANAPRQSGAPIPLLVGVTNQVGHQIVEQGEFLPNVEYSVPDALQWHANVEPPQIEVLESEGVVVSSHGDVLSRGGELNVEVKVRYQAGSLEGRNANLVQCLKQKGYPNGVIDPQFHVDDIDASVFWIKVEDFHSYRSSPSLLERAVSEEPLLEPTYRRLSDQDGVGSVYELEWNVHLSIALEEGDYIGVVLIQDRSEESLALSLLSEAYEHPEAFDPRIWNPSIGFGVSAVPLRRVASAFRLRVSAVEGDFDLTPIVLFPNEETDDGDFLPDSWEASYFGTTSFTDGSYDDNENNQNELVDFLSGVPAEHPHLVRVVVNTPKRHGTIEFDQRWEPGRWFAKNEALRWRVSPKLLEVKGQTMYLEKVLRGDEVVYEAEAPDYSNEWRKYGSDSYFTYVLTPANSEVFQLEWAEWAMIDRDGDGLSDWEERLLGLNPFDQDSDGDGVLDAEDHYPLNSNLQNIDQVGFDASVPFQLQVINPGTSVASSELVSGQ